MLMDRKGLQEEIDREDILIVDDSRNNLRLLSELLVQQGYIVRPVPDGRLALSSIITAPPDLILLDIMMPGMTGYEVCERLKSEEHLRDIPVIFISALDDILDKVKAFSIGGVDYITKPFQSEEVLARIQTHLMLRRLQNTLQKNNVQLHQEIVERKRIEEAMRRRNQELDLLNQMNILLQACSDEDATYGVLKNICRQLFPLDSGCLYLINEGQTKLDIAIFWGVSPPEAQILDNAYWDNSTGRIYTIEHAQKPPLHLYLSSSHGNDADPYALRNASGEVLGILYLHSQPYNYDEFDAKSIQTLELKHLVATRFVEQYALFLVNLRLLKALKREAIRDPLTNLFNRRYMEEALAREVQRADRHNTPVGIIMLDVDHFKDFNDAHGHEAGDVVLQKLGALLQQNIRGGDVACRYGGEEFLLILPDTSLSITEERAYELLTKTRRLQIFRQDKIFQITISLGVAVLPNHGHDVQSIVNAADIALYQAKHNGRDQVVVAPI